MIVPATGWAVVVVVVVVVMVVMASSAWEKDDRQSFIVWRAQCS
jgi:hypothetical protein